jgi:hypothetical protein
MDMHDELYCNKVAYDVSQYKSYWAFVWLLTCTENQFRWFEESPIPDIDRNFLWAYQTFDIQNDLWHGGRK